MALTRREFLKWLSAGAGAGALAGCETPGSVGDAPPARRASSSSAAATAARRRRNT